MTQVAHPGPALLHRVGPTAGLTEDDLAVVKAWVHEVAGPPVAEVVPPLLRAIMDARYDYDDGKGVDFEPYSELEPIAATGCLTCVPGSTTPAAHGQPCVSHR